MPREKRNQLLEIDTEVEGLTLREERFAQYLFAGLTQRQAYLKAYTDRTRKMTTVDNNASVLAKTPKLKARLKELADAEFRELHMSRDELLSVTAEICRSKEEKTADRLKAGTNYAKLEGYNKERDGVNIDQREIHIHITPEEEEL